MTAGEDITGQGVQVAVGRDVTLSAADDIALASAQNGYALDFESSSQSASVGASVGIGVTGWTASGSASVSASASEREVDSLTHTNSRINAGRDLSLTSGDDTTLEGALSAAEGDMDVAVGGDLTVASVQDTARIDGSSRGFSAGLSYGHGGGDWGDGGVQSSENGDEGDNGPSVVERMGLSGSLSHGDEKGRKAWVREQSGLVAGGGADVEVGDHTQLDGSVVASTGGDVTLETDNRDSLGTGTPASMFNGAQTNSELLMRQLGQGSYLASAPSPLSRWINSSSQEFKMPLLDRERQLKIPKTLCVT